LPWAQVVAPLRRYIQEGGPAPDRDQPGRNRSGGLPMWRARLARGRYIWRTEGFATLVHRLARHVRWRLLR
jgi:hypothetical protein